MSREIIKKSIENTKAMIDNSDAFKKDKKIEEAKIDRYDVRFVLCGLRFQPNYLVEKKIAEEYNEGSAIGFWTDVVEKLVHKHEHRLKKQEAITKEQYMKKPKDYRGVWTVERPDWNNWDNEKAFYMDKRTMLKNENGATVLVIEGMHFYFVKADEQE